MNKTYTIIEAPFHMGIENIAVGKGPRKLIDAGADQTLACKGIPAQVVHTRKMGEPGHDEDYIVDLNRQIRHHVREAIEEDAVPVILGGNCNTCLGTLGAFEDATKIGIIWLDKHADFNTPETSTTGYLDGMSLAIALGYCHEDLKERIGFTSLVHDANVLLLGTHDIDPEEEQRLAESNIAVRPPDRLETIKDLVEGLRERVEGIYLHIDVDVLEKLPLESACTLVGYIARSFPILAINLTNYNPENDKQEQTQAAVLKLLELIAMESC